MLAALENWCRTPPALRPVEPVASSFSRSSKTTSVIPRRERWYATEAPIQPPPTITTSAVRFTLHCFHDPEQIAAENLQDVRLRVALVEQRLGDPRQLGRVVHPERHRGAVEIGAEAHVIDAGDLHGVVDVLDDLLPAHPGQEPLLHRVAIEPLAFHNRARFVGAALLRDRLALRLELGAPRRGAEFFAEEAGVIIDHHHAAV